MKLLQVLMKDIRFMIVFMTHSENFLSFYYLDNTETVGTAMSSMLPLFCSINSLANFLFIFLSEDNY